MGTTFKVDFVGLVYFHKENGGRLALLPDGRRSEPPHTARIVVPRTAIRSETGWRRGPLSVRLGEFKLPPCTITVSGADVGQLDTSEHDGKLLRLAQVASGFRVNPKRAKTVASMSIQNGKLRAYRFPGSIDTPRASTVSQLELDHDGDITVTVTPLDRSMPPRTIVLGPGTEIAIVNDSTDDDREVEHFHIYDQLTDTGVTVGPHVPDVPVSLPELPTNNPVFGDQINGDDLCPNSCC